MKIVCFYFDSPVNIQSVAEVLQPYSPQLAVRPQHAVFIEIEQCAKIYSYEEMLSQTEALFENLQLRPRVGVGPSVPLALLSAIYNTTDLKEVSLEALRYFFDPFSQQ